jgi:hypothetical protein
MKRNENGYKSMNRDKGNEKEWKGIKRNRAQIIRPGPGLGPGLGIGNPQP